ncbi:MAG: hypothetical protein JF626_06965, partial [Polaromonas sp.]|nr:hypothetical protein [Polaromonas sp.]
MTDPGISSTDDYPTLPNSAMEEEGAAPPATRLSLRAWFVEGLRAGIFLMPRVAGRTPTPLQALILTALVVAVEVALFRIEIAGPARLDVQA